MPAVDILLCLLSINEEEEAEEKVVEEHDKRTQELSQRKIVIKNKVRTVARMRGMFKTLRYECVL